MHTKKKYTITDTIIIPVLLTLICIALPAICSAQDSPQDPNDVPIDGGLSLLLAAGAAYGIKKYHNYKKIDKEETAVK